ncbi:hypothetical protein SAMN02745883_00941 [Caminicella sporogenes DSM 14501]|uniref:Cache domain-containing protein n=1 Tax=Caminicella sporogenes DSM 14501 TaxID=1121266 RepID=A0A1M6NM40_9FIRM|nr:cache domain-containing protein [Caminicella sporogenes]RKD22155.1 hypothetical protein BET04_05890 [Caminicella sporogenes]SHJ96789.1 hypothetical protein SAMN02745883_00941 [Caminicella sporogenes DSM 14501]
MIRLNPKYIKILGMIMISILPTIIASFLFLDIDNETNVNLTMSSLYTVGNNYKQQVNNWIEEILFTLKALAYSNPVKNMDRDKMAGIIEYVKANKELYREIYVVDRNYNVIYGYVNQLTDFRNEGWLEKAFQGQIGISTVRFRGNSAIIEVAVPIVNEKAVVGAMCASIRLSYLNDIMEDIRLMDDTVEGYLVNKEGIFITESRFHPDAVGREKVDVKRVKLNIDYSRETPYLDYRGEEVYGIYFDIPFNNWTLIVEKDKKEVNKNNKDIVKIGEYLTGFEVAAMALLQKLFNGEFKNIFSKSIIVDKELNLEFNLDEKGKKDDEDDVV